MDPKFNTCFFERYAKVSLVELLGEKYANLQNFDRPDLQDVNQGLGIEVTRAINENKQTAELLVNEMAGRRIFDIGNDDLLSIDQYGYAYGLYDGSVVGRLEYEYWSLALPLRRIIKSKVHKVADGFYGDFREFGLYIFSKGNLSPDEVKLAMDYTLELQNGSERRYSKLYISQIQSIAVCNLQQNEVENYSISQELRRTFYKRAVGSN